jgi:putative SOS response-associated peptidase YedK
MCGRFTFQISPELLIEIFDLSELPALPYRYNIAPTQQIPIIRQYADGQNHLDFLRWGLIPSWAKRYIRLKDGAPMVYAGLHKEVERAFAATGESEESTDR